eukprot:2226411-Prymnesium_polylepis.1
MPLAGPLRPISTSEAPRLRAFRDSTYVNTSSAVSTPAVLTTYIYVSTDLLLTQECIADPEGW